jgi:hypothetical protein
MARNGGLNVGRAKLQILLDSHGGAEAAELSFKVHLCIEGIIYHVC